MTSRRPGAQAEMYGAVKHNRVKWSVNGGAIAGSRDGPFLRSFVRTEDESLRTKTCVFDVLVVRAGPSP